MEGSLCSELLLKNKDVKPSDFSTAYNEKHKVLCNNQTLYPAFKCFFTPFKSDHLNRLDSKLFDMIVGQKSDPTLLNSMIYSNNVTAIVQYGKDNTTNNAVPIFYQTDSYSIQGMTVRGGNITHKFYKLIKNDSIKLTSDNFEQVLQNCLESFIFMRCFEVVSNTAILSDEGDQSAIFEAIINSMLIAVTRNTEQMYLKSKDYGAPERWERHYNEVVNNTHWADLFEAYILLAKEFTKSDICYDALNVIRANKDKFNEAMRDVAFKSLEVWGYLYQQDPAEIAPFVHIMENILKKPKYVPKKQSEPTVSDTSQRPVVQINLQTEKEWDYGYKITVGENSKSPILLPMLSSSKIKAVISYCKEVKKQEGFNSTEILKTSRYVLEKIKSDAEPTSVYRLIRRYINFTPNNLEQILDDIIEDFVFAKIFRCEKGGEVNLYKNIAILSDKGEEESAVFAVIIQSMLNLALCGFSKYGETTIKSSIEKGWLDNMMFDEYLESCEKYMGDEDDYLLSMFMHQNKGLYQITDYKRGLTQDKSCVS